jgi:hypothetical protein
MSKTAGSLGVAAILGVLVGTGGVGKTAAKDHAKSESETFTITLRVYDYVRMKRPALLAAEGEAGAILDQAGLEARWVDCPTSEAELENYPDCPSVWQVNDFVLRVLPNAMVEPRAKWQEALGFTPECDAVGTCTISIFHDRVKDMAEGEKATLPILLGRAMAHEIGHLLLGANSHSRTGIMRAQWFGEDLSLAASPHLLFTAEQSRQMRTRLTERAHAGQTKAAGLGRR